MTDRETKTITTQNGHSIVLRTYLTGKESKQLKAIMYADMKLDASDPTSGKISLSEIPAEFILKQEQQALEFLVVSVDTNVTNQLEALENLPEADYNEVLAEVQKIRVPFREAK